MSILLTVIVTFFAGVKMETQACMWICRNTWKSTVYQN